MVEEEDSKRFDSVNGENEDSQPDPDEPLMMDAGNGRVWLVKIPRHLMERWSAIDEEGVPLATIRVYHNAETATGKKPRIMLLLPPNPETGAEAEEYEMDMVNDDVENQIVVAEREKEPGTQSRARTTILTGRVKHECNLRPILTDRYRQRLKMRNLSANQPTRRIRMIEDAVPGGRGNINMLTSGAAQHSPFSLVRPKAKPAKGQFERMARMPRDQLLDELFKAFQERERWSIKALRERTQQPEAYLKEVLSEIAFLHRSGEFNGSWELMANYKGEGMKAEDVPGPSGVKVEDIKMEGEDEEDDDDDEDDDDMEEVS
ncbi:transcription initiation factor IIF beta subunit [Dichomitus squalens LYAD-421 SS1]|uniref:Transcription initiation factor IIF subunit beta n=1 Tax=Dichomitus squalens (strain LYAD-421) TaxID=732165 RepID=R7SSE1_DICSQ|nr:transcription initiation factor IIF beta subunit [Dichomitus squalens LYAD-421 SS1]EJF58635.1 transcription initiation factor IIF beta subunit [Dichomitus squalens LYAD-421 SS1]